MARRKPHHSRLALSVEDGRREVMSRDAVDARSQFRQGMYSVSYLRYVHASPNHVDNQPSCRELVACVQWLAEIGSGSQYTRFRRTNLAAAFGQYFYLAPSIKISAHYSSIYNQCPVFSIHTFAAHGPCGSSWQAFYPTSWTPKKKCTVHLCWTSTQLVCKCNHI
jgi:hypothetical protein